MGTKLVIWTLLFDIMLALMVGAYSGMSAPSIPIQPTELQAQQLVDITWAVGWGQLTLIPPVTLLPQFSIAGSTIGPVVVPGMTIPAVTLFSVSFEWLWPIVYVFLWVIWVFTTIADVIGYILSVFTSSVSLLASVPVIGPFLDAIILILNFVLIWEIIKMIAGVRI